MKSQFKLFLAGLCLSITISPPVFSQQATEDTSVQNNWTDAEISLLRSLWIGSLTALPADPSNAVADNSKAAELGHKIFFDTRFSANGKISCATCHKPEKGFTDGLDRAQGIGKTQRSSPSLVGIAYSPWYFWDGRSDSQWSQALGPLENGLEHAGNRTQYAHILYRDAQYRKMYEALFGTMPDLSDSSRFPESAGPVSNRDINFAWFEMKKADKETINQIFANIGKSIAAYERLILPGASRFDHYVEALLNNDTVKMQQSLNENEVDGLRLFTGKAMCVTCHNSPLFTHHGFHNIGIPIAKGLPKDPGRFKGIQIAKKDEFNCLGKYSSASENDCVELRFAKTMIDETIGAFKVPTLRNIAQTAPYMHSGQFPSLSDVIKHYNTVPRAITGHSDLLEINLTTNELKQLEAFLGSLDSEPAIAQKFLKAPES